MQFRINYAAVSLELTPPPPPSSMSAGHAVTPCVQCRHTGTPCRHTDTPCVSTQAAASSFIQIFIYSMRKSFEPVFDSLDRFLTL